MGDNLESKIIDIESRRQAKQPACVAEQAQPVGPAPAEEIPTARSNLVSRQVQQHGVKWACPACAQELMIWNDKLAGAVARDELPRVNCPHCQTVHALDKQLIFSPSEAQRIAVPTMQLRRGR